MLNKSGCVVPLFRYGNEFQEQYEVNASLYGNMECRWTTMSLNTSTVKIGYRDLLTLQPKNDPMSSFASQRGVYVKLYEMANPSKLEDNLSYFQMKHEKKMYYNLLKNTLLLFVCLLLPVFLNFASRYCPKFLIIQLICVSQKVLNQHRIIAQMFYFRLPRGKFCQ